MGGKISVRKVDSKGRVYLGGRLRGVKMYMADIGDMLILSVSRKSLVEAIEKLRGESVLREYLGLLERLGEPGPEEVERLARRRMWRKLEGY